jgi:arylsulfatase A-like enzyme
MNRREFCFTAGAPIFAPGILTQKPRRNIVFILVDDHRWDFLSAMQHPWLETPETDKLFDAGVSFENAFVTTSLCSPSRATILTSQYMHAHGVRDNFTRLDPKLPTFPQALQKAGYETAFIGKWHMGGAGDEARPGFNHWVSFRGQGDFFDPTINFNGDRKRVSGYVTDILTDEALQFLRTSGRNQPFCLYLSHKAVHHDFQPAPRHRGLYTTRPVPYPETMPYRQEYYEQLPDWVRRRRYSRHGVDGLLGQTATFDEFYRDYCRCLMAVDESVGRVITQLNELGLANDTLVLYMGDNGYLWGEQGFVDKRSMHDPSIRVPLIAYCPDLFDGARRLPQIALNLDVGPTVLDAAGVEIPTTFQGRSVIPLLQNRSREWRTSFLYEYEWERDYPYTPSITGLRSEEYSFMQYYGIWDKDELYDMRNDPQQTHNLLGRNRIVLQRGRLFHQIEDDELREIVLDMQKAMAQILSETGGDPRLSGLVQTGDKLAW